MMVMTRDEVKAKMDKGYVMVIDVLSPEQYQEYHLPQAANVPFGDQFEERIQQVAPNKDQAIIVYCMDEKCNASSKAADKLSLMGYMEVYDYEAGKKDWKEAGLPVES